MSTEVSEVKKTGDWYTIKGHVKGREVSVDIPAPQVEGRTVGNAREFFKKSLETTERAERSADT